MINIIKTGSNILNISINGKLHKKVCDSIEETNDIFKIALTVKANPSEDNIKKLRGYLNEKLRVAIDAGLEHDIENGEIYLAGFNTPIPKTLIDIIRDYHENNFPLDAIINFWKLLMLNPDVRIREVLFDFINAHDFVLTDNGYMVVYKAVYVNNKSIDTTFATFVSNRYLHVKKQWKKNPDKYVVYINSNGEYQITKTITAENWNETEMGIEFLGNLDELFNALFNNQNNEEKSILTPTYTDMHTQKMEIKLGVPVKQLRKDCDANFREDCSNGLHVGATKYVEKFANWNNSHDKAILVCYINPMNVIAVPEYDHSKMRVCEYFPFAIATFDNNKIDIIEQKYFETDYCDYELSTLNEQIEAIQANEKPILKAMNAPDDERPMTELLKIINSRIVDIT